MPRKLQALYSASNLTGSVTSPTVTVPSDVDYVYATIILSAPISPLNVYDISVFIDVFEDGAWRTRDSNLFQRDLLTGPVEAINYTCAARLERVAGKDVRARLSCGQCVLAASVAIE